MYTSYDPENECWRFMVGLSLGIKPDAWRSLRHIIGVHIAPRAGWFAQVLSLDGTPVVEHHLDEYRVATLLGNHDPDEEARKSVHKRTPKERHHRMADALTALCNQYDACLAVQDVNRLLQGNSTTRKEMLEHAVSMIMEYLPYKLAQCNIPAPIVIKYLSPRRDCGACGTRHLEPVVVHNQFVCPACDHQQDAQQNTAREVARRGLWALVNRRATPVHDKELHVGA